MTYRITLILSLLLAGQAAAQDFISIENTRFMEGKNEFSFLGLNAYYLFSETALGRSFIADEVFEAAEEIGARVIRTWAFYEADGQVNQAVIRPSPYDYNEEALKALDYVVFKAKEKNIRLILTLANNYPDYGGIPQYLEWGIKYTGRNYSKADFFVDDTLKSWYKNYLHYLLNRVNIYTGVSYRNEPALFSFELINEASNQGGSSVILNNWYREMSAYFKSIDRNHLLTTGEVGEDDDRNLYSDVNLFYNSSSFLFNGYKGTSYSKNLAVTGIDYGSFHLYTGGWGILPAAGRNWIKEHLSIAENAGKPSLLSEFGTRDNKEETYRKWLNELSMRNCRSAIAWQYLHPAAGSQDGFGFSLSDTALIRILREFIEVINQPPVVQELPENAELFQNYPNPFNPVTTIKYSLNTDDEITVELFNAVGERIGVLDEGFRKRGAYELILSFNSGIYASGAYFYTLTTSKERMAKKLILLK